MVEGRAAQAAEHFAGDVGRRAGHAHIHAVAVEAPGEFAFLLAQEEAAAPAAGAAHRADRAVEAVGHALAARGLAVGHEVEHAAHAFGVIADARVGDDLDVLDGAGGHHLEDLGRVAGEHLARLAVHGDLEAGRAVDGDVVLTVHGDHRDLAEHFQDRGGLGVHVVRDIIGHPVDLHLHERALGGDRSALQGLDVVLDEDLAEAVTLFAVEGEDDAAVLPADAGEQQRVLARAGQALAELAVQVGRREGDGLFGIRRLEELDDGRRFALAGQGVENRAADDGALCVQCRECGHGEDQGCDDSFHIFFVFILFSFRILLQN